MNNNCSNFQNRFMLILIVLLISACSNIQEIEESHLATVTEVNTLNNKEAEDTPIVSAVSITVTDSENNIYLVDPRNLMIHAYSDELTYRWSAGGKGSGPGLFTSISALYAVDQQLYAYDAANAIMTQYALNGEMLEDWAYHEASQRMNSIRRMGNGKFLVAGWNEKSEILVHLYSDNFKKKINSFIESDQIFHSQRPALEKQVLRNFPGFVLPVNDSTVIYAPHSYNGTLPIYQIKNGHNWVKVDSIEGYNRFKDPIVFHYSSTGNSERSHLSGFDPRGGYFHTQFNSMSHGLYELNNGLIAHLSSRLKSNDQWDMIIEYFEPQSLKLKDFHIVKDLIPTFRPQQLPLWMDQKGQIYVSQNSDIPLRILRIVNTD
ncbi:MAG: hypothetical protein R3211_07140 [Balneolaceae bacterium]|nr:hypothetical protein [Balneolaceae bacterium]